MLSNISLNARVVIAGHTGLVSYAALRHLEAESLTNIVAATREQLDLRGRAAVNWWFQADRPEYVFLVAGIVCGILVNSTRTAEFICDNMMRQNSLWKGGTVGNRSDSSLHPESSP